MFADGLYLHSFRNQMLCRYDDRLNGVSALWMVVAWRCEKSSGKWDKLVKLMVENGADVNNWPHHSMGRGITVFGQAVEKCSYETIEYLLKAGANPNNVGGRRPLEIANLQRGEDIARLLKEYGAT